eukprot:2347569-Alexandrium_andersonii.AAC.1
MKWLSRHAMTPGGFAMRCLPPPGGQRSEGLADTPSSVLRLQNHDVTGAVLGRRQQHEAIGPTVLALERPDV